MYCNYTYDLCEEIRKKNTAAELKFPATKNCTLRNFEYKLKFSTKEYWFGVCNFNKNVEEGVKKSLQIDTHSLQPPAN